MPATQDWNAYYQARHEEVELFSGEVMVVRDAGILYGAEVIGPMLDALGADAKDVIGAFGEMKNWSAADYKAAFEAGTHSEDGVPIDPETGEPVETDPEQMFTVGIKLIAKVSSYIAPLARAILPRCVKQPQIVLDDKIALDSEGRLKPGKYPLDAIAPWDMLMLIVKALNVSKLLDPEVMQFFLGALPALPVGDKAE